MTSPLRTWEAIWEHVKAQRPEWRVEPPLGALLEDGGRLLLLRRFRAVEQERPRLVYLAADGSFVEVASETDHGSRVELVDGRVIQP